jgi:hypothetical protein
MGSTAQKNDEIGSTNGSAQRPSGGGRDKRARMKNSRSLMIKQGKRLRKKDDTLAWYAASAYGPEKVRSHWQKALDTEHNRYELPDPYKDYTSDNPTSTQYGLVETAVKNYAKSRRRLSDTVQVGV